ncbi:putative alpha/beta hydrolase [Botrytis cinerea]
MATSDTEASRSQQSPLASSREASKGVPQAKGFFPLGYKPAFNWLCPVSAGTSTLSVNDDPNALSTPVQTNSINDPYGPRQWHSNLVKLSGKNRALNEFSVERVGEKVEDTLVMLHGYGAGLGFFYKNFEGLSRVPGWKIYALDMLGMGRSTRPPFKISAKDQAGKIAETESWFIDALEEWRVLKKLDKFTLLGHSMGGYMAVAYALKYPGHLNKLILASPVGIPEDPYATSAAMPEPEESTLASEFTQDQETDIVSSSSSNPSRRTTGGDNNNFGNMRNKRENNKSKNEPAKRPLPFWLTYLWDANAVNKSLPLPLPPHPSPKKEHGYPVLLMYGDNDWMDVAGGYAAEQACKEEREKTLAKASKEEKELENGSAKVVIIQKAGHHLYLDGWEEFNEFMRGEMKETTMDNRKMKSVLEKLGVEVEERS